MEDKPFAIVEKDLNQWDVVIDCGPDLPRLYFGCVEEFHAVKKAEFLNAAVQARVDEAVEKAREERAYRDAHPTIEFVDGESGIERTAKFEYGEWETGIPDGWYVEDDYRPIRETLYWRMKQVIDALQVDRRRLKKAVKEAVARAYEDAAKIAEAHMDGDGHLVGERIASDIIAARLRSISTSSETGKGV